MEEQKVVKKLMANETNEISWGGVAGALQVLETYAHEFYITHKDERYIVFAKVHNDDKTLSGFDLPPLLEQMAHWLVK